MACRLQSCALGALVNQLLAVVAVSYPAGRTGTVVPGRVVNAVGVGIAPMSAELTLVNLGIAGQPVTIEPGATLACVPRECLTVDGRLAGANGISVTVVIAVSTVVWLVTCA